MRTARQTATLWAMALALVAASAAQAGVTFAWNPATNGPSVSGYRLYAGTNAVSATSYALRVDCGTNTTVSIERPAPGEWHFMATAYATVTNGTQADTMESDPSNELLLRVPSAPERMATVAVQWIGTLAGTNWTDVGFFRLKVGMP